MQYRYLGKDKLKVSALGLGCMGFTQSYPPYLPENEAIFVLQQAVDLGINFFDTAEVYGPYTNEELLGKALKPYRSQIVLATKFGFDLAHKMDNANRPVALSSKPKDIRNALEGSLKRLQTDYIDLYYCHRFDPDTPMEETLQTLSDLVDQGKILYYGVSEEWSAARLERAQRIIRMGIASVDRCPAGIQHDEPAYRLNVGCVWLRAEVSFFALSLSLVGS